MNRDYLKIIGIVALILVSLCYGKKNYDSFMSREQAVILEKRLTDAANNCWRFSEDGKPYLKIIVNGGDCPVGVMEDKMHKVVDTFNYKVQAKSNNRRSGIITKDLGPEKYEVPIEGVIKDGRIILQSKNLHEEFPKK